MSDKWILLLDEKQILRGHYEFPAKLLSIFQGDDKKMVTDWARITDEINRIPPGVDTPVELIQKSENYSNSHPNSTELFCYSTDVETIIGRLRLMGFTPEASRTVMSEIRESTLRRNGDRPDELHTHDGNSYSMRCTEVVDRGLSAYLANCSSNTSRGPGKELGGIDKACLAEVEYYIENLDDDPLFILSALLKDAHPSQRVTIDLSQLLQADYFSSWDDLSAQAVRDLNREAQKFGPVIVITEGKFDSDVLSRALHLVRPDVAGYFNFWKIDTMKAAGGTDQVVRSLRSFAAAGVMNRVIGILDNDTAGRQAEKQLSETPLPEHFGVFRLPDVEYAHAYPTLGPSGESVDDVTRRACTLEFYFGLDCLRGPDGNPIPVRWKGYNDQMRDYQGELTNKPYVQERIREMLSETENHGDTQGAKWDPLRAIARNLVRLAEPDPEA